MSKSLLDHPRVETLRDQPRGVRVAERVGCHRRRQPDRTVRGAPKPLVEAVALDQSSLRHGEDRVVGRELLQVLGQRVNDEPRKRDCSQPGPCLRRAVERLAPGDPLDLFDNLKALAEEVHPRQAQASPCAVCL